MILKIIYIILDIYLVPLVPVTVYATITYGLLTVALKKT